MRLLARLLLLLLILGSLLACSSIMLAISVATNFIIELLLIKVLSENSNFQINQKDILLFCLRRLNANDH